MADFGAFSAPANASVFGTAVQSSPFSLAGGKAAFGGMRNASGGTAAFGDDDEDDDDGRQRVELREDSITLDQVGSYSLWRKEGADSLLFPGQAHRDAERMEEYARVASPTAHVTAHASCIFEIHLVDHLHLPILVFLPPSQFLGLPRITCSIDT